MRLSHATVELRERLAEAVERMADSDTFVAWLRARATFHDYSLSNSILIATQRPDATRVAGFKAWRSLGRQVRQGERGIRILAPCVRHVDDERTGERTRHVVGFRCVCVFDIAQTDGDELPVLEYRPLDGDATDLAAFVCDVAMSAGLEIRRRPLTGGIHGYLARAQRSIVVDCTQSGAMAAKVVAHELGHYFDPWLAEHPQQYAAHRGDCEAVAESVAFVVAASFGLDAGPAAVGYVAAWVAGDAARVRDLAERIDASVAAILSMSGGDATHPPVPTRRRAHGSHDPEPPAPARSPYTTRQRRGLAVDLVVRGAWADADHPETHLPDGRAEMIGDGRADPDLCAVSRPGTATIVAGVEPAVGMPTDRVSDGVAALRTPSGCSR